MMSKRIGILLSFIGVVALTSFSLLRSADRGSAKPTKSVESFSLKEPRTQRTVSLSQFKKARAIVVVFLGTECPINNLFLTELSKLHDDYAKKGITFLGINSNAQDTPIEVANHARKHAVPFPILKDPGNKVADNFGAKRTPESFVLSPKGAILYRGRIDDQFGIDYQRAGKPNRRDLAVALDEIIAGKAVSVPHTKAEGCLIGRTVEPKPDGKVTFYKHVLPILQNNCQTCHRPGQIGPMPLKDYRDVVAWSGMIDEVVREKRMPPWLADPRHGEFANDRRLPEADRKLLLGWIDNGMAKGDPKDAPPEKAFPEGWTIGKPDVIFKMPKPFKVPAEMPKGGVPYKYFSVPTNFEEDRWVVRAEAKPDATPVVHHVLVFIQAPGRLFRPEHPESTLAGNAPGELPVVLPDGYAKRIPKGSRLVFQMHYTPNGKEYVDQSSVGLIFAKKPPKYQVLTRPILNTKFVFRRDSIPPGARNYKMESTFTFKQPGRIVALMPHMHLRGKDFRYDAVYPSGKRETLLYVPRYDFNWQTGYRLKKPLPVPAGTKIHCIAHFDNSSENPNNPDPTKNVGWGDQTWQEMMIGWLDYSFAPLTESKE